MAQLQVQAKEGSSADTRKRTNVAAAKGRGRQLASRENLAWPAGPFGLMRRLSDDMDQIFGQLIGGIGTGSRDRMLLASPVVLGVPVDWMPAIEILERDGKLVIQADLPGVAADDITVEVADGILTVSGERREEHEIDSDGFRRTERRYGRFSRSIALPEGARAENIQASFRDGVLEITVPLPEPPPQRRTIDIQSAQHSEPRAGSAQAGTDTGASASKNASAAARESAGGANTDTSQGSQGATTS